MELVAGNSAPTDSSLYSFEINETSPEEELHDMLILLQTIHQEEYSVQMETYMGLMARCTELKVFCLEREGRDRQLKVMRTQKLQPIMDLIEFLWRGVSRLVEVKKMEVELSR